MISTNAVSTDTINMQKKIKFFVDEIKGIDLFAERNPLGENLFDMADRLGHEDIVTFFCEHKSIQKVFRRIKDMLCRPTNRR